MLNSVLGTVVAATIIEKAGRKQLLVNSYLGQAAAMLLMVGVLGCLFSVHFFICTCKFHAVK